MNMILPLSFDVELTNICRNNCRVCPRHGIKRPFGFMKIDTFGEIIRNLREYKPLISLSGMGDILLHPQYHEFIKIARDNDIEINLVINPSSIDESHIQRILHSKPDSVLISFPSLRKEVFEYICPSISYEGALEITNRFINLAKGSIYIRIGGILTKLNRDEEKSFREFWKIRKINSFMVRCHSRGGNLKEPVLYFKKKEKTEIVTYCYLFRYHTFIDWEGNILSCCHDLTGETTMGNISQGINNILMKKLDLFEKNVDFNICKVCDEELKDVIIPEIGKFTTEKTFRTDFFRKIRKKMKEI